MSTRKIRTALRRSATVLVASALTLGTGIGAAFAFPSGNNPGATGPNHIEWTGQGATNGHLDSSDCSAQGDPNGANQPYLYWVLTTDGGSVNTNPADTTDLPLPAIHLIVNGTPQAPVSFDSSSSSNSVKFITPYFTPDSTLAANADFNVLTTGNGSWNLVISHGCAGPGQASSPTISKVGAVSYNTAYTWSIAKTRTSPAEIDINPSGTATATYQVVVTNTGSSNNHIVVNGTIDVTNPNSQPISLAGAGNGVSDPALSDGAPCTINGPPVTQLNPGDNNISYSCIVPNGTPTSEINGLTNTATVTWGDQTLGDGSHLDGSSASYTLASIPPAQGQPTTTDQCVTPSDPQAPPNTFTQVCASDGSKTFTYQVNYPITPGMVGTCTSFTNTATLNDAAGDSSSAGVKVCVGADLIVKKDATPTFTRTYAWTLAKSSSQDGQGNLVTPAGTPVTVNYTVTPASTYTDSGWKVTGTITVTNPNDWESVPLTGVTDQIDNNGGQACSFTSGNPVGTIAASSSEKLTYECDYPATGPTVPAFNNTATATWVPGTAFTDHGSASDTVSGAFGAPTTSVDKCVTVTDTLGGPLGQRCAGDGLGPFTYPVTFNTQANPDPPGQCTQHPNTATFITSDTHTGGSAGDSVTVCVAEDLGLLKIASPAFNRDYQWTISKTANPMSLVDGGTVNYTVTASQTGQTDSGWNVTGQITVSNPNQFESVSGINVSDKLSSGDAPCVVANGTNLTLPPATQTVLSYTCTYQHAPSVTNDANNAGVTWNQAAANTPDGFAAFGVPFAWGAPTTRTHQTVTVTDSQGGTLGTVTATDAPAPLASKTFSYSKTFGAPAAGCPVIVNTATINTPPPGNSAQGNVTNCTLGALTMGFWHNMNGQAIIKGDTGTNLYTYLHQFAPFSDLTGTSSSAVAAYFLKVFNAANAAGSGAPMLKAQMLATALNVYFSQNGNNKIGAPAPIGGVLLKIPAADQPAFGGAASMTVSQMLSYASSQWDGGTPYGSKMLTSEAIDTFTQVNQSQLTSP